MEPRINFPRVAPGVLEAMLNLSNYLRTCGLEESLMNLVHLRVSQMNGCAYCIDMHWKDLKVEESRIRSSMGWMPGRNRPITRTANGPPSPGRRR